MNMVFASRKVTKTNGGEIEKERIIQFQERRNTSKNHGIDGRCNRKPQKGLKGITCGQKLER